VRGGEESIGKAKIEVFRYNSDLLIERQLAVLYDGGTKTKDWCEGINDFLSIKREMGEFTLEQIFLVNTFSHKNGLLNLLKNLLIYFRLFNGGEFIEGKGILKYYNLAT